MLKDRLKNLRNEMKLTQGELAEKLNIALTTYSNYEQGTRHPDYNILCQLADIFSCSTDYLLCRTNNKQESLKNPTEGQILITKAAKANVTVSELEAYIEARKRTQNIKD